MKWIKAAWTFILKHLPQLFRFIYRHIADYQDECDVCNETDGSACCDCPLYGDCKDEGKEV